MSLVKSVLQSTPPPADSRFPTSVVNANQRPQAPSPTAVMMMIYIVVVVGQFENIIPGIHHVSFAKIISALAILFALRNRATLAPIRVWSLPPARLTILFMSLVAVSISFSILKHATLGTVIGTGLSVCVGLVLMIKSAINWRSIRYLLFGCVLSALVLCFAAEITRYAGRAGDNGNLDPNDFAFVLDGLLPIVATFALVSRGVKRISYSAASLWVILEILRTESRGGLLGLLSVITLIIVLLPINRRDRILPRPSKAMIAGRIALMMLGGIVVWHLIPHSARVRFETLRHADSGYNANLNNPNGRLAIWLQALPLTLRRPWGWGAGAFNAADGMFGGGNYRAAHNMYLQALIELGVEGLAVFLAVLVSSVRRLKREAFARPDPIELDELERRAFARAMIASFAGFCVAGFFLAELYIQVLWIVVGLSCLVGRSAGASHHKPFGAGTVTS